MLTVWNGYQLYMYLEKWMGRIEKISGSRSVVFVLKNELQTQIKINGSATMLEGFESQSNSSK